jgi:hypothetical protein
MKHQLDVAESMKEARMDDVHDVRKIQSAIDVLGPAAFAAEKFPRARVAHQPFHWPFENHVPRLRQTAQNPNGVYA